MKILWVATKLPWPPVDGGRLLMVRSFQALAEAGHLPTVVAPDGGDAEAARIALEALAPWAHLEAVPARARSRGQALVGSLLGGPPWTLGRHALPAVAARVAELASTGYDGVLAEQLQALGSVPKGLDFPVVWRAQNVESDLWTATAVRRRPPMRWILAREARRLAHHEGRAAAKATAVVCLTREDRDRLRILAGEQVGGEGAAGTENLEVRPTPFPPTLPTAEDALPGDPAVVVLGSAGWWPNQEGLDWFARAVAPKLFARAPEARIHAFGSPPTEPVADARWIRHPAPEDSRQVFAPGSVLAVPLFVASGVRMKILEAWARGVPVVATSVAARGLGAEAGRQLLVADEADEFAAALTRVGAEPSTAEGLVAAGREHLRRYHDAEDFAEGLLSLFRRLRRHGI